MRQMVSSHIAPVEPGIPLPASMHFSESEAVPLPSPGSIHLPQDVLSFFIEAPPHKITESLTKFSGM